MTRTVTQQSIPGRGTTQPDALGQSTLQPGIPRSQNGATRTAGTTETVATATPADDRLVGAIAADKTTAETDIKDLRTRRTGPAPMGAAELDRLVHERLRLGILSALAVNESLSFNDLKKLLKTTDGNLSVHARKLEEAGYLTCSKYFEGRVPKTDYRMTTRGRQALERYLEYMEALIHATRAG